MELTKNFDSSAREPEIYKKWEGSGYFNPDNLPRTIGEAPFTIIMPPPNANGSLHIGHALFVTTQDIMIRYKRMQGFKTLWLPGADHAGFETQVVYMKKLEKEGRKFWDIPREQLYKEILEFTLANKSHMEGQLKALGASCDWSREKFTLDEDIKKVVYETFKMLYDDGLIYRGNRIINWCSKHQTSLSDLEILHPETTDPLYYLKYGPFTIATARPETKFGDKYVIVHPDDPRYAQYKNGEQFEFEWINGPIKATLIKDPINDMAFGTGAMTITPWHSGVDFDLAQKYKLPIEQIIDWKGKIMPIGGEFAGIHISKARAMIVEKMKAKGLLVKIEDAKHSVPVCFKCNTAIEPQVRPQWFMAMTKEGKSLRDLAVDAVNSGAVTFTTERFKTEFLHWMENLRDWNISRQIVWGIQIPMWYCISCKTPKACLKDYSKVWMVRHGQTDWNAQEKIQGLTDTELNDEGIRQAEQTAKQLSAQKVDIIVSSDLKRAQKTAEIIAKATGTKLVIDSQMRERNYGEVEGKHRDEWFVGMAEIEKQYEGKPEGGESFKELEERMHKAFVSHRKEYAGKNIVFVSHGAALTSLIGKLKQLDFETSRQNRLGNGEVVELDHDAPCEKCKGDLYEQDPDVFDTWFSSGQWPFATLMTAKPGDFEKFYPTDVMETGWDILFFWVARMVMFGLYRTGKVPFKTVYLNGLVRDKDRQKMSKSKGNVVDPLGVAGEYGTDAVRMALISGNAAGTDPVISEDKIRGYRNFTTKLWNMGKFLLEHADQTQNPPAGGTQIGADRNREVLDELAKVKHEITGYLDEYKLHLAAESIYHYTWHTVADVLIEQSKEGKVSADTLKTVFMECLKMLHPFMPFVTEEIWNKFNTSLLIVEKW